MKIPGVDTIKTMMRSRNVDWLESDKSKGSRAIGKEAIPDWANQC